MTQEDKELLLKDLSGRLPYGVKVTTTNPAAEFGVMSGISIKGKISVNTKDADIVFECTEIKPYLRPMSSMTEEEENKYRAINCYEGLFPCNEEALDYALSHHFDYRGLIEKGIALEAPEGMYNLNK